MTPAQEAALLDATAAAVDAAARDAQAEVVRLIIDGVQPRDAVLQATEHLQGDFAAAVAAALSRILGESIGEAAVLEIRVGPVTLSQRFYAEAEAVAAAVMYVVLQHSRGFEDARRLALHLFESYGSRAADQEPIRFKSTEGRLPRDLRELVRDSWLASGFERAFARIQVGNLAGPALRAAYSELLSAIDALANSEGLKRLEKRLEEAFYERMRYFARRIAMTELHRAYMRKSSAEIMNDQGVQWVQVSRGSASAPPCFCDLLTGRDVYGKGAGVYPKSSAPLPPYHPNCYCWWKRRPDILDPVAPPPKPEADADVYFLKRLGQRVAARVMGSAQKRDRVLVQGQTALEVANSTRDPAYRIGTLGEVTPRP